MDAQPGELGAGHRVGIETCAARHRLYASRADRIHRRTLRRDRDQRGDDAGGTVAARRAADRAYSARRGARAADERIDRRQGADRRATRSEEHTSELQQLMRISYAVLCLKKKKPTTQIT